MEFLNFGVEVIQDLTEPSGQRVIFREKRGPIWSKDPQIQLAIEEGGPEAVGGRGIMVRAADSVNEAFEPEPTEVVRHLSRGIRTAEERFDVRTKIAIAEADPETQAPARDRRRSVKGMDRQLDPGRHRHPFGDMGS